MAKMASKTFMTPPFIASYPNLFKPRMNNLSKKMEYGLEAIFPKGETLAALKKVIEEVLTEQWGPEVKRPKGLKNTIIKLQDEKAKFDEKAQKEVLPSPYQKGALYLRLKSNDKPGVVNQAVEPVLDPSEFYAGCKARASISVYCYDQSGSKGVTIGLNNVQKVGEGEPLSGRPKPEDDFAPIESSDSLMD